MKTTLLFVLFLFSAVALTRAQAPKISKAPKAIQELAESIKGKNRNDVRAIIIDRFGPPKRDVGSGARIEQWDVSGGLLTFHHLLGPTFSDPKTKAYFWLLQTKNPAQDNILGSYEMTINPDPAYRRTQFWLGNLKLSPVGTYQFTDSGQHPTHRAAQTDNFFMLYPVGTFEVQYLAPVTADTLLESVGEGETIAELLFTSEDKEHKTTFFITSSERFRFLIFDAKVPIPFSMRSGWKSFWR